MVGNGLRLRLSDARETDDLSGLACDTSEVPHLTSCTVLRLVRWPTAWLVCRYVYRSLLSPSALALSSPVTSVDALYAPSSLAGQAMGTFFSLFLSSFEEASNETFGDEMAIQKMALSR